MLSQLIRSLCVIILELAVQRKSGYSMSLGLCMNLILQVLLFFFHQGIKQKTLSCQKSETQAEEDWSKVLG